MRNTLALTVILFALVGCATTANYEKILNSWIGYTELELIRKWGPPQQSYEAGGIKFLVYSSSRNVHIPGATPSYTTTVIGNTVYTNQVGGTPDQNIGLNCQTTFEISGERVVSWRWQGNDCTAID